MVESSKREARASENRTWGDTSLDLAAVRRAVTSHKAEGLCACLLLLMAVNLITAITRKSITNDETVLIPSAYYHLVAADFQLVHEHPPLCKILAGIPLLFIQPNEVQPQQIEGIPDSSERGWAYEESFWQDNRADFQKISFWARVPMISLTLALGLLIFAFGRELFGPRAAILAVALFTLEPTVLAHGRVVQTDMPATFGYLLVCFTLYRYLSQPTWRRAAWVGLAGGISLLSKFSMIIVGPVLAVVFLALLWRAPLPRRRLAGHAALAALAMILIVSAAYGFNSRAITSEDGRWLATAFPSASGVATVSVRALSYVVPTDFVLGIFWQLQHSQQGHAASLLGMYSKTGWRYYFPVAFAFKTTIPFLLLSLAALGWGLYQAISNRERQLLMLLIPFALYTAFIMMSRINIGVRYYLPAYPFLFLLGGALLDRLLRSHRAQVAGIVTTVVLLCWCGVEAARFYPNYTPYMNQLALGRPHWWYLSDSNVEWGDDVGDLAAYLRARGETKVRAALLGGYRTLGFYGVEYVDMFSEAEEPNTRYVAVGASFLNGSTVPEYTGTGIRPEEERINFFDAYRHRAPEAVLGNSIYLFRMHE